jgi:hypothetical protein
MMKLAMSAAAAALLRALLNRTGVSRDRILLTDFRSTDWRSLTFEGERHEITLRLAGRDAATIAQTLLDGLEEADFPIPGHVLADIAIVRRQEEDRSILVTIEALTIAD